MSIDNKPEPENPEKKPENPQKQNKPNNVKTCCIGCLVIFLFIAIIGQINRYVTEHRKPPQPTQAEVENQQHRQEPKTAKQETVKQDVKPSPKQTEQQGSVSPDNVPIEFMRGAAKLTEKLAYETQEGLLKSEILVSTKKQMVISVWTEPMSLLESLDIADSVIIGYPIVLKRAGADWITGMPPVRKEDVTAANLPSIYKLFTEQPDYGNLYDPYEVLIMVYQQDGEQEVLVYKKVKNKGERLKRVFAEQIQEQEE